MMAEGRDPLSHAVLGAAFEVSNHLGHGFLEAVYRRALVRELRQRGLPVLEEIAFPALYKGAEVGRYIADVVVDGTLIVELKCAEALASAHLAQTLNYLRASGIPAALLINFGKPRLEYRRLVLS
jgi:GxxExxY protein